MRSLLILVTSLSLPLFFAMPSASAKGAAKKAKTTKVAGISKDLSQDIKFSDQLIQGRYNYSDEALVTVENEKYLDDLLGVRKNFKDRVKLSTKKY